MGNRTKPPHSVQSKLSTKNNGPTMKGIKLAKSRSGLDQQILNVYADEAMPELKVERNSDSDDLGNESPNQPDFSDDEEIDEELAFDSCDEDQFAGNGRRSENLIKRLGPANSATHNASPDDEDESSTAETDEDADDYMDLSEMLGQTPESIPDAAPVLHITEPKHTPSSFIDPLDVPYSSDDSEDEDTDLGDRIVQLLQTHDASKANELKQQRKVHLEYVEAYDEGEYSLPGRDSKHLDINSLVSVLSEEKDLGKLKGQVVKLRHDNAESKVESVPIPDREKNRISRIAGYSTVAEEVDRFQPIVERNRNAKNLHFELVEERSTVSTSKLVTDFVPSTTLDHAIESVVSQSKFNESETSNDFGLPVNEVNMDEEMKRRSDVRWMRELAFRQELKAKRHAKIKSKTYRKILKKQKLKSQEAELDRVLKNDPEAARAHLVKLEIDRVKSRALQKRHLNSKWAQVMAKHGENISQTNAETREQIMDQIKSVEQLASQIRGCPNEQSSEGSDVEEPIDEVPEKGLFAMKFMQRAAHVREQELIDLETDDFDAPSTDDAECDRRVIGTGSNPVAGKQGPSTGILVPGVKSKIVKQNSTNLNAVNRASAKPARISSAQIDFSTPSATSQNNSKSTETNPWSTDHSSGSIQNRSLPKLGKLQKKQLKHLTKMDARQDQADGDIGSRKRKVPELDMDVINTVIDPISSEDNDNDDAEATNDQANVKKVRKPPVQLQKDLVKQAFAGDDVVMDFIEEKADLKRKEGDVQIDETLPGWGCWGGSAIEPKCGIKVKVVKGVAETDRQDRKYDHVMISEKRQKQLATKYMASKVPHPYVSAYQYEQAMHQSIGKEWVTLTSMRQLTVPKVSSAQGAVIKPIRFNKAEAESWVCKKKQARDDLIAARKKNKKKKSNAVENKMGGTVVKRVQNQSHN